MKTKLDRLAHMSGKEVSYRLNEALRVQTDRFRYWLNLDLERDDEFDELLKTYQGSFKSYLESIALQRFYASLTPQNRDHTIDVLLQIPSAVARISEEAEQLLEHRVNLLGYTCVGLGQEIDWHRDPVTGYRWPKQFWADFNFPSNSGADPKIIHELNRHQHLPRLAKAYVLTGDERFAREAVSQMESWMNQNPRWEGVNWQSSLEVGTRVLSWLWTVFMLVPSKALDERIACRIGRSLLQQVDQVFRYPSIYSSPNTHLIGEATTLFIAGLVFREIPRSAGWRSRGKTLLIDEMQRQVLNDGVYSELSSYYHCYAADFFLHAMALARAQREPLPEAMWKRLESMLEFALHLTRPNGTIPLIGDDDGGRTLALASEHYGSFRDGLSSGAVLFGRPDFKFAANGFAEETLWLLGPDAAPVFESLPSRAPSRLHAFCLDSGYFIQRSGWEEQSSHLTFDCGGHGYGSGGHSHSDALSVTLFSGGTELLVDPATFVYNCAPEWRTFFRSTRAHNTVVVDGMDQSSQGDTFNWQATLSTRLSKQLAIGELEYLDGEHDGYLRLRQPVIHRRRVLYVRPNYWILVDNFRGYGEHTFDFMYHFAPGAKLFILGEEQNGEIECRARIDRAALQLSIFASAPMRAEALCGQVAPIQGWTSTRYGERKPAPVFKGTIRGCAPVAAMSFLVPQAANERAGMRTRRLRVAGGPAIAGAITDGEFEDICVVAQESSGPMRLMDFSMSGELFWIRTINGAVRQLMAVNASSFAISGETIFQERQPLSHVSVHLWENGMLIEHGDEEGKVYVRDLRDRQFQRH